jgi:hypothetical protein
MLSIQLDHEVIILTLTVLDLLGTIAFLAFLWCVKDVYEEMKNVQFTRTYFTSQRFIWFVLYRFRDCVLIILSCWGLAAGLPILVSHIDLLSEPDRTNVQLVGHIVSILSIFLFFIVECFVTTVIRTRIENMRWGSTHVPDEVMVSIARAQVGTVAPAA